MSIKVQVRDVADVVAQSADGYYVYPHAHASGGTLLHRAIEGGAEDFVSFEARPSVPEVDYDLTLGDAVSGLRLVGGTLELLDGDGAPRLRVNPPFIAGADGLRTSATLAVEGCTVDNDPAAPWGRSVMAPGADSCTVRVRWPDEHVKYPAVLDPQWTATNEMSVPRQDATAILLSTGKVLVAGGRSNPTSTTGLSTAELYDPTSGTWSPTGSMAGARYQHTMTQLGSTGSGATSGMVLVAGGANGGSSLATAELYSPSAGTWAAAANLNAPRQAQSATLLADGRVLLAGGKSGTGVLVTGVLYNPASGTGTWTPTGTIPPPGVWNHTASLLVTSNSQLSNKVLLVGGDGGSGALSSVFLFDPSSAQFSTLTSLPSPREGHTATTLASGKVLIAGGQNGGSSLATTEVFDPSSGPGSWSSGGTMTALRTGHFAVPLPAAVGGGQVLVGGGSNSTGTLGTSELWNGTTTWTATASLTSPVQGATATVLPNNLVLVAGGSDAGQTTALAELYNGSSTLSCTSNSQCATGFCVSGVCCNTACNAGCGVCNLPGHVGTCSATSSGTVCRAATGACDVAEACDGTSLACPTDAVEPLGAVCRPASGPCDQTGTCDGNTKACPADAFVSAGTICRSSDGQIATCTGTSPGCPAETSASADVLGFEAVNDWSFASGGSVLGLSANHTQGHSSLVVTAQNYAPLNSLPLSAIGPVGTAGLLDFQLPVETHGSSWFGYVQMFVNSPSLGIYNVYLGQVNLAGLPLGQWVTLPFQLPASVASQLSQGGYTDLTFQIDLNLPSTETGQFLLDNLRFTSPVTPTLLGIAQNSAGTTESVFTYSSTASGAVNILYGAANGLSDQNGFIASPPQMPPEWFEPTPHPPFVAALTGQSLTWTIDGVSATATLQSPQLPVTVQSDGTRVAQLPDGTTVNLDVGPADALLTQTIVASDTSFTAVDQSVDAELTSQGQTPNGPTSAGTLPGNFRVTDDGAAEYTIPIQTPPGRNGVEPHLSLVYNSRVGDGILGPGWTLQGLHKISRCRHPFSISQEKGNDPAPITFTDSDDFCFDGERLVSFGTEYRTKRDQGSRFVVTSRDSLGPVSFQVFRKDGLIETYGGNDNANDLRGQYTSISIDPSVPAGHVATSPVTPVRLAWELASVADRFGNTMTFSYTKSSPHGAQGAATPPLLSSIAYTAGVTHPATKSVSFQYNSAPELPSTTPGIAATPVIDHWLSGVDTAQPLFKLTNIVVTAPNPVKIGKVTEYKLYYDNPSITGRNLLTRVTRCGADGVCLQPTTFDWEPGSYDFRAVTTDIDDFHCESCNLNASVASAYEGNSRFLVAADINRDGHDDLLYRSFVPFAPNPSEQQALNTISLSTVRVRLGSATGFGPAIETGMPAPPTQQTPIPVPVPFDINGDGATDFAIPAYQIVLPYIVTSWTLFQTDPNAIAFDQLPLGLTPAQYTDPNFNPEAGPPQLWGSMVPADLTGSGLLDATRSEAGNALGIRMSTNGVLGPYQQVVNNGQLVLWGGPAQNIFPWEQYAADLDGDGRTELLMQDANGATFGIHAGQGGFSSIPTNMTAINNCNTRLMDLNGDGLLDVVRSFDGLNCNDDYKSAISTGIGYYTAQNLQRAVANVNPQGFVTNGAMDSVIGVVADLNGDGMDDVFVPGCAASGTTGPQATAYISTGVGNFTPVTLNIPAGLGMTNEIPNGGVQTCPSVLMDVDGDGQKDLVQPEPGSDVLHIYFRNSKKPDRINAVTNGLHSTTSIEYSRFSDTRGDTTCGPPFNCSARNVDIVAGYSVDNGHVGNGTSLVLAQQTLDTTHYTMSYAGARADSMGNGWLGFEIVRRTDDRTGAVYERDFDLETRIGNWYPYEGLPKTESFQVTFSQSGATILRNRQTTYMATQSNINDLRGPYIVVPTDIDETESEAASGQSLNGLTPQRHTHQHFTYGGEGNVTQRETTDSVSGTDELVTYTVTDDYPNWLLDKVSQIVKVSTSAAGEKDQQVTGFSVDPSTGAVTAETIEPGDPIEQRAVTYGRNAEGLITSIGEIPAVGEPRSRRIDYDRIDGTLPAVLTNAAGQVTQVAIHPGLNVLGAVSDPNGATTHWQYDSLGQWRAEFAVDGMSVSQHYSRPQTNVGAITSWSDSTGRSGIDTYDTLGREVTASETAFDGVHQLSSSIFYDVNSGRPGAVSRPFGAASASNPSFWNTTYDEIGRVSSIQPPNESLRAITYQGLLTTEFTAEVESAQYLHDGAGRLIQSTNFDLTSTAPNGAIVTGYDYGPFGNLRHVYEPGGAGTATLSYDHLGHPTEIIDPDAGGRVTGYDSYGEVISQQFPGQNVVQHTRDVLGRITQTQQDANVTGYTWDVAPYGIGMLASSTSPSNVTVTQTYQPNGLTQASTWTVGSSQFTFDWGYDASGRLQNITYPDVGISPRFGVVVGYGPDGRPATINAAGTTTSLWQKTAVANDGQTSTELYADGLQSSHDTDPLTGRVTHISTGSGAVVTASDGGRAFANTIQSLGYTYFADGKLDTRSDFLLGSVETFGYDNLNRVKTWTLPEQQLTVNYTYDDSGNLRQRQQSGPSGATTESYTYGENGAGPHALTTGPAGSYGYDTSGRQTSRPGQPVLNYTFFDLPTEINSDANGSVTFGYDADGARVEKTTTGGDIITIGGGLYERRIEDGLVTHVFYLPGDGTIVGQITCDAGGTCAAPTFFHPDKLGTIDTVERQGNVVGREKRDPFGRDYDSMIAGVLDPAAVTADFTGEEEDSETGLVNLNARLYDAQIGRFISPDPLIKDLTDGQSFNRYAYASNNPLSLVDRSGLQAAPADASECCGIEPLNGPVDLGGDPAGPANTPGGGNQGDGLPPALPSFTSAPTGSLAAPGDPTAPQTFGALSSPPAMPVIPHFNMPASTSVAFANGMQSGGPAGGGGAAPAPGCCGVPSETETREERYERIRLHFGWGMTPRLRQLHATFEYDPKFSFGDTVAFTLGNNVSGALYIHVSPDADTMSDEDLAVSLHHEWQGHALYYDKGTHPQNFAVPPLKLKVPNLGMKDVVEIAFEAHLKMQDALFAADIKNWPEFQIRVDSAEILFSVIEEYGKKVEGKILTITHY